MNTTTNKERGGIRISIVLIVATGVCLWMGGQGIYTALKNQQPTALACRDLGKGKPTADWLLLTDCELHLGDSAYLIRKSKYDAGGAGRITEAYVPIRARGQSPDAQCYAVMATKDSRTLSLLEEMRQAKTEEAAIKFLERRAKELVVKRDVSGLVRFGVEEKNGEHAKLAGLKGNLAPDYIILAEGEEPRLGFSAGLFLLGLCLAGGFIFMLNAGREPETE